MKFRKRIYYDMWGGERRESNLEFIARKVFKPGVVVLSLFADGMIIGAYAASRRRALMAMAGGLLIGGLAYYSTLL